MTRVQELLAERGCEVSYSSLRRFIQRRGWRRRQQPTVRMEDGPPGEVAEMDFGRLGLITDPESGRRRTVWALIVVWRYSRHCFVWPTTSQRLDAVVEGLEAAWACFEGVPRYLVIDNFPAAVAGADALHPRFTRGFLEYARHRGFITDPARVRRPRDKPRVERSVPYVRERFFKGADFRDLAEMRSAARRWCLEVPGQRIHGTPPRRRRGSRSRSSARSWCASTTAARCSRSTRASPGADASPTATTTRPSSAPTRCARPTAGGARPNWARRSFAERLFEGPLPWAKLRQGTSCCAGRALLPRPPRRRLPPRARGRPRDVRQRILVEALEQETTQLAGPLRPPRRRLRTDQHADHDRSVTMTATTAELRPLLKRLKHPTPCPSALSRRDATDPNDYPARGGLSP